MSSNNQVTKVGFTTDDYRNIDSFEAAASLLETKMGPLTDVADDLGDGFAVLATEDKARLVKVPLIFIDWRFTLGDQGEFVSAHVITKSGDKYIVNDGSTGIYQQLQEYTERTGKEGGLFASHGLRRSDYTYQDKNDGKMKPATTYYIDTSA